MKTLMHAALALGLAAGASAPAFADCAGHRSADAQTKPVTTADSGPQTPAPAPDKQG